MLLCTSLINRLSQDGNGFFAQNQMPVNRLDAGELGDARRNRLRLIKMHSIIREIVTYCCFIWMIYTLSYANRNSNAFLQVNHLRQYFLNIGNAANDYSHVSVHQERERDLNVSSIRLRPFMITGHG
jgi:hypothetical protein